MEGTFPEAGSNIVDPFSQDVTADLIRDGRTGDLLTAAQIDIVAGRMAHADMADSLARRAAEA